VQALNPRTLGSMASTLTIAPHRRHLAWRSRVLQSNSVLTRQCCVLVEHCDSRTHVSRSNLRPAEYNAGVTNSGIQKTGLSPVETGISQTSRFICVVQRGRRPQYHYHCFLSRSCVMYGRWKTETARHWLLNNNVRFELVGSFRAFTAIGRPALRGEGPCRH
jgi:hypothetical protein